MRRLSSFLLEHKSENIFFSFYFISSSSLFTVVWRSHVSNYNKLIVYYTPRDRHRVCSSLATSQGWRDSVCFSRLSWTNVHLGISEEKKMRRLSSFLPEHKSENIFFSLYFFFFKTFTFYSCVKWCYVSNNNKQIICNKARDRNRVCSSQATSQEWRDSVCFYCLPWKILYLQISDKKMRRLSSFLLEHKNENICFSFYFISSSSLQSCDALMFRSTISRSFTTN